MKKIIKPNQNNPEAKKKQVTHMFDGISKSYDLLNRIITLGIDVIWRKRVVRLLKKEAPDTILDIATGTGDLVLALAKLNAKKIIGLDISPGMLEIGKKKVLAQNLTDRIKMQLGDSEALHYEDNSFAAVTVAFGVRNFENLDKGLLEIFRVLKPKGTLVILETAVPKNYFLKTFYMLYTQNIMPFIGKLFSKDRSAYKYLSDSAAAFPHGEVFNNILRKNGFIEVEDLPQTLGIASIYFAKKA
ncbi:bifunctional demethylmenaquinone methyltransferase/2-methoxy-6-polyprenyl-1,4-benzoquinol methylase UbiE [Flavobacteriaceae bacterium]|jgi:demethylmenaquinone methyltransferase/2-methoxy-6-polyprenyl-1,4-benzoquinol methylase|nr:bifunctional demethylmenaquinone methyltransferase/2-methoxy-6-polyprenyl-1,4-benzoquinol methylase UbiE [Flavobacteriaceae bacterium]MDB4027534.1 bifunctional demethylmenaquinone methyltransferase/2-methoxy-6-polyprenyl-1,4-benzoquinol methylase UbiE [bacterium]MBT4312830.1 bifunctional demethylmenaquinone methyltransferase/2-methoxy-6-polyprenyl-1,4-benzoquinol methylase UbiE [Flavobacteriaceae bacterium]MBT5092058.1 bifunctional demethylmenaquinone methyltransferase/2-methoxy-6-polyprenyl-|tara:strand:- start:16544 stop:17275 length:732 start_codon:yes stop_codon:yes gene_type:complete